MLNQRGAHRPEMQPCMRCVCICVCFFSSSFFLTVSSFALYFCSFLSVSLCVCVCMYQLAHQVLSLLLVLCSAVMIWKGLVVMSGSDTPVVVVLSGSMEPAIWRGDILFLWQDRSQPYEIGEIVVYQIKHRPIPIIHRIIEVHTDAKTGKVHILTKGDNNPSEDRALYNTETGASKLWLEESEVLGRAKAYLPQVGKLTIYLTDYPVLKFILIAVLGLFVLTAKE